jgi:hypothetical protein
MHKREIRIGALMNSIKISNQTRQKLKNEIKEIMVNQAGMKKPIYYSDLCRKISSVKLNPDDQLLHDILGKISKESVEANKYMLSVYAIKRDTGIPGNGFFSYAKKLGYSIGSRDKFVKDQMELVHKQYRDPSILTF